MASKTSFATEVLRGLGIKPNAGNLQAMVGWMNAEGGHWKNDARYNPLNTTQPEPGAGNTGTQGNIKVYKSWDQGVKATVTTLKNGHYGAIINALKGSNPQAVASAIGSTPWGTSGGLVARAIAGAPKGLAPQGGSILSTNSTKPSGGTTATTTTTTTPAVNNHSQRAALFLSALHDGSFDSPAGLATLASNFKAVQDIPAKTVTVKGPGQVADSGSVGHDLATYVQRATVIDKQHLGYQWGGGHGGKTSINKAIPLDCSGAVSKVLGIDPRVAAQFKTFGSPGDGGNHGITIYAKDSHVLMKINGHFFGTSGSNPGGGAGWIEASAISPQYLQGFTARHLAKV